MNKQHNPAQLKNHLLYLTMPAFKVEDFRYTDLADNTVLPADHPYFAQGEGFTLRNGELALVGIGLLRTPGVYFSGVVIPPLATAGLKDKITKFIDYVRKIMEEKQSLAL